eukprot:6205677-Pleurochrysis_carterae.AAC.1
MIHVLILSKYSIVKDRWDGLGIVKDRLINVTCCYCDSCAFLEEHHARYTLLQANLRDFTKLQIPRWLATSQ